MRKALFAYVGMLMLAGPPVHADEVLANMAYEASECVVYFTIVAEAMSDAKEPAIAARANAASESVHGWALWLTNYAGLREETVGANIKLATRKMFARIDHKMANISILVAEY